MSERVDEELDELTSSISILELEFNLEIEEVMF